MLKKYCYLTVQKLGQYSLLERLLILIIFLLAELGLILLSDALKTYSIYFSILFFFCIGLILCLVIGKISGDESLFLKNGISDFNEKIWNFYREVSIHFLIILPLVIYWLMNGNLLIPSLSYFLGVVVGDIGINKIVKIEKFKIHTKFLVPVAVEKELSIWLNQPFLYLFIFFYLISIFLIAINEFWRTLLIFAIIFMFQDSLVLNSIGVELRELNYLRREGHLKIKSLYKKFFLYFIGGLILIVFLSLIMNFLQVNFILFYLINFMISSILSLKYPFQEGTAAKVKIGAVYLELIVMLSVAYLLLVLSSRLFLILLSLLIVFLGVILIRQIRKFCYGN